MKNKETDTEIPFELLKAINNKPTIFDSEYYLQALFTNTINPENPHTNIAITPLAGINPLTEGFNLPIPWNSTLPNNRWHNTTILTAK